jgi:hypothetical protein
MATRSSEIALRNLGHGYTTSGRVPSERRCSTGDREGKMSGYVETPETPNVCSVCGQSFDSEDELRSHEAEQHPEMGSEQTGGEQRGSAGPGEGMGREQGGGVAGG